jgi:hypothetical protein
MTRIKPANSGRKLGTPNRRTKDAQAILKKLKFCPLENMVEVARAAQADGNLALQGQMSRDLARYLYPQRKAIEHSNPDSENSLPTQIIFTVTDNPAPQGDDELLN